MTPWEHLAQKMINSNAIFQSGLQKDQSGITVRYTIMIMITIMKIVMSL